MRIQVECYSGYKSSERPVRFLLGRQWIQVEEVADRWYGQDGGYFRVLGSDGNLYILKGPIEDGSWQLVSFTRKDSQGTELKFDEEEEKKLH